ncbi:hypothetical protein [Bacteroides reticulotermitis]|uniref:hypothetical protein n=1 Tax=Bacteroides reticulotermitis TaxID=1133319 RepID=UPI003A838055
MKRIIVFTLVLCSLTCIFSQKKSLTIYTLKTEYEKTDSNTYIIEYNSNSRKKIRNKKNPFEGVESEPWQGRMKIPTTTGRTPSIICQEVLGPYCKKNDSISTYVRLFFDLKGDLKYLLLLLPAETPIPIRAIEEIEDKLKKEFKIQPVYDPEKAKGVNYIIWVELFWVTPQKTAL